MLVPPGVDHRLDILRRPSIFGGLSDTTLAFLLERADRVEVATGECFCIESERGGALYVLERGLAEAVKIRGETTVRLTEIRPGDCFGEVAVVGILPRSATVRALEECGALRIASPALSALCGRDLEQYSLIMMNLAREVARRLHAANEMLLELGVPPR